MGCFEAKSHLKNENFEFQNQKLKLASESNSLSTHERLLKFEEEYEIIGQLFSNPLKNVKKIVHKASGKVLCMRVLKKNSVSEKDQNRFYNQIEILRNLEHPSIIKLIDDFNDNLSCYLITEFCNGGELFDKVVNQIYLQEKQAANVLNQLLSAISFCHKNHIVHRDIKPENILFESESPDSSIKLTDFKNSKVFKPEKRMKKKLGGTFYLAPEVIKGSYTEKCDIWSCGVVLYLILCGYPPFSGNTDEKIEEKILLGEFDFKGKEWRDVSIEAKRILQKLLEYDETKRISAEEALKDDWFNINRKKSNNEVLAKKHSTVLEASDLKKIIYEYIQNNKSLEDDNLKLKQIFESFDQDHDYHLPLDSVLKSFEIFKIDNVDKISWVDSLLDGLADESINYNEILMITYNKRIVINKENFERAMSSLIKKDEEVYVQIDELLGEFKKESMENDDWISIMLKFQKKKKGEKVLIDDLKEEILKI